MKNKQRTFVRNFAIASITAIIAFAFCTCQTLGSKSDSASASSSSSSKSSSASPSIVYSPESDFEYHALSNGQGIYITKYIGSAAVVNIPPTIQGQPVIGVSRYNAKIPNDTNGDIGVFEGNKTVTTVIVPEGVNDIYQAFKNTIIESVTLPASFEMLSGTDFQGSTSLVTIILKRESIGPTGARFLGTRLRTAFTPGIHSSANIRFMVPYNSYYSYLRENNWRSIGERLVPTNAIVKINVINHTYSNPKLPVTVWIGEDKSTAKTIAWGHDVEFSVPIPDGETQVVLYAERSDHSGNPTKYTHTFTYASIMDTAMLRYFKDGSDLPFLGKR